MMKMNVFNNEEACLLKETIEPSEIYVDMYVENPDSGEIYLWLDYWRIK